MTPTLMTVNVVSFSFSRCSTGGPGVHSAGWWLSLLHPISNSGPQTPSGFPRAPSAECGFPYHISSITPSPTVTGTQTRTQLNSNSVLTEFNAHSITHSIFEIACLIVIKQKQLSCSSQVTLFRCVSLWVYHGNFLPHPISSANFRPRDFLS